MTVLLALGVAGVIGLELVARFVLRLGDPPLYVADPEVEYLMKPSSRYNRFYAISTYNKWSMRGTPDIEKAKADPREFRLLMLGDSIVNGGPQTDDSQLATTILAPRLASRLGRAAVVANISAGSWGPPNLLAYAKKFGLFGADVVVIVLNFEDATDAPVFGPLGADHPTRTPVFALEEALFRYLPALVGWRLSSVTPPKTNAEAIAKDEAACTGALRELVLLARGQGCKVVGVLHATVAEAQGSPMPGTLRLKSVFRELGVPVRDTAPVFREALAGGRRVYRDEIHLMPEGQVILADEIDAGVADALR